MTSADPVEALADRLYALPPAQFVQERDDAVRAARMRGDRKQAAAIMKLRRPVMAAWLVNLLALHRVELLEDLLALGAKLREAQRDLRGQALRELASQRRVAVAALVSQACDLAVGAGVSRAGLPAAEVESTLTAALADPDVARDVMSRRLVKPVSYGGIGMPSRPDLYVLPGGGEPGLSGPGVSELRAVPEPATEPAAEPATGPPAEPGVRETYHEARRGYDDARYRYDEALSGYDDAIRAATVAAGAVTELTTDISQLAEELAEAESMAAALRYRLDTVAAQLANAQVEAVERNSGAASARSDLEAARDAMDSARARMDDARTDPRPEDE